MLCGRPFPVHVFPQIIRNAVYEVEQHTQAPQALIAASVLGLFLLPARTGLMCAD
jgi:hypothetical protein